MDSSQDKRGFPRAKTRVQIQVDTGVDRLSGEIQDLTVEGMAFTLGRELTVGSQVKVEIISASEEVRSNTLKAEVLRCEPGSGKATALRFRISTKLIDANDEYLMDALALVHGRRS